jgi:hypothetical protein
VLDQALGLLDHHLGHLHVAAGGSSKVRGDHLAAHGALHLGHFFRALVDQQHDQVALGVVAHDRLGDVLQHHGLAGLRRRDDQAALALADRRADQVDDAPVRSSVLPLPARASGACGNSGVRFSNSTLLRRILGRSKLISLDLQQREVALAVLRRADLAGDGVAGAQVEAADLAGRDVDVVGAGQVGAVRRAQEAEAVLQDFEHAVAGDVPRRSSRGAFRREKMMSCLRERAMFSMPMASAISTSSLMGFSLSSVRFMSTSILQTFSRPAYSRAISSSTGAIILHGPHHSAQ